MLSDRFDVMTKSAQFTVALRESLPPTATTFEVEFALDVSEPVRPSYDPNDPHDPNHLPQCP